MFDGVRPDGGESRGVDCDVNCENINVCGDQNGEVDESGSATHCSEVLDARDGVPAQRVSLWECSLNEVLCYGQEKVAAMSWVSQ